MWQSPVWYKLDQTIAAAPDNLLGGSVVVDRCLQPVVAGQLPESALLREVVVNYTGCSFLQLLPP